MSSSQWSHHSQQEAGRGKQIGLPIVKSIKGQREAACHRCEDMGSCFSATKDY